MLPLLVFSALDIICFQPRPERTTVCVTGCFFLHYDSIYLYPALVSQDGDTRSSSRLARPFVLLNIIILKASATFIKPDFLLFCMSYSQSLDAIRCPAIGGIVVGLK